MRTGMMSLFLVAMLLGTAFGSDYFECYIDVSEGVNNGKIVARPVEFLSAGTYFFINLSNDTYEYPASVRADESIRDGIPWLVSTDANGAIGKRSFRPQFWYTSQEWIDYRSAHPEARWIDMLFPCSSAVDRLTMKVGFKKTNTYQIKIVGDSVFGTDGHPISALHCDSVSYRLVDGSTVILPSKATSEPVVSRNDGSFVGIRPTYAYLIDKGGSIQSCQNVNIEYCDTDGARADLMWKFVVDIAGGGGKTDADEDGADDLSEVMYGSNPLDFNMRPNYEAGLDEEQDPNCEECASGPGELPDIGSGEFELDISEARRRFASVLEGLGYDVTELLSYDPREFSQKIQIPIGYLEDEVVWYEFEFNLNDLPEEVDAVVGEAMSFVRVLAQALMSVMFFRSFFNLLWNL